MSDSDHRHVRRLQLLDVGFELSSADPACFSLVDLLFGGPEFRPDGREPGVRAIFHRNDVSPAGVEGPSGEKHVLVGASEDASGEVADWTFRAFLNSSRGFHLVHAGSLVRSGQGILLVGPPFAGKTTLTLALCREGFHYFSDDIGALGRADGRLHPFRRQAGVRAAEGGRNYVAPDGCADPLGAPAPCPLAWVFILEPQPPAPSVKAAARRTGVGRARVAVEPAVEELSISDTTLEVLRHTLNRAGRQELQERYGDHPHLQIFAELLEFVAGARCFRLRAGEPAETASMVRRLVDEVRPRRSGGLPPPAR